jgi:hypothetical protein
MKAARFRFLGMSYRRIALVLRVSRPVVVKAVRYARVGGHTRDVFDLRQGAG